MGLASASELQVSSERSAQSADPAAKVAKPGRAAIRLATEEADIRAMIVLGRQMHAEGRFKKFFYDEARLLAALRQRAKVAGAVELNLGATMGVDRAPSDRFLRRMGFRQTGGNYVLGVDANE